ncbi:MAG: polysaccharide biosynthesis tyrosine autokinase [Planctomycetota bacterium]|nr:MAG: polysaccharide biosynthesis tyrosine autokinase [Planctomycetota bacterium]
MSERFRMSVDEKPFVFGAPPEQAAGLRLDYDALRVAWRYRWLLGTAAAAGLVLGLLAYQLAGPRYEATSRILVAQRADVLEKDNPASTSGVGGRGEHVTLIMSPLIVGRAVREHGLDRLPSLSRSRDPVEDIVESLKVMRIAGHDRSLLNVLEIKYTSPRRDDAKRVVQAIIDAYHDYLQEAQREHLDELATLIRRANDDLRRQFQEVERAYVAFRERAPLIWKTPVGAEATGDDVTNVHQENLIAIDEERRRNLLARAEIASKIKAIEQALRRGDSRASLEALVRLYLSATERPMSAAAVNASPSQGDDGRLLSLILEEKRLLQDYGPDHPAVQNVRESIRELYRYYRRTGRPIPGFATSDGTVDIVSVYLQSLRQQLEAIDHREAELKAAYERESQLAKQFARYQVEDQKYRRELARIQSLWDAVIRRMDELELEQNNAPYSVRQIAPVQDVLVLKRPIKFCGGLMMAMLAVTGAFVYWRDLRDTRLRTPAELQLLLEQPVYGAIPRFTPYSPEELEQIAASPQSEAFVYRHRPDGPEAEAYRAARTALLVGLADATPVALQVTSPEPGDGKTTFAANFALAMAESGRRVCVIDADLRRPTIHRVFGLRREIGTADVLQGEIDLVTALQPTINERLMVLSAGTPVERPAELLSRVDLKALVTEAKRHFDIVVLDSPPVLAVSDTCLIGRHVDHCVLVVRIEKNTRPVLRQALETLAIHGVKLLGCVANDVQPRLEDGYRYAGSYAEYVGTVGKSAPPRFDASPAMAKAGRSAGR